uniref:Ion transport protein n=1 Tax=Dulem virus 33 TaxID=3145751 RepID=A0AAU8B7Q9_9CAUD
MKKRIYEIIEVSKPGDIASGLYDGVMIAVIVLSIFPLAFKETTAAFEIIDKITVAIFIIDYFFRLITADIKLRKGPASFFLYPLSPMALIDLISILPSFTPISGGFRLLKIFRFLRALRVFRIFKSFRYSKSITIIIDVIRSQKEPLIAVCSLAVGYVLVSALVIFNVEPDTFETFFDAVYWATVSLTTMGYGDIYPVTTIGRIVTMISSFVGIAIVALPAGIITAGYMERINHN